MAGSAFVTYLERVAHVELERVAATRGGEYAGPCPFCGGEDRFRVQPERGEYGNWWCRQCSPGERWEGGVNFVMRYEHLRFPQAVARLGGSLPDPDPNHLARRGVRVSTDSEPPNAEWQERALAFVERCEGRIWEGELGAGALRYLHKRGLRDETIVAWRLGFTNGQDHVGSFRTRREQQDDRPLPSGIVLPWFMDKELWGVKFRRPDAVDKKLRYGSLMGGKYGLYLPQTLKQGKPIVICEGEFDALTIWQEAGDLVSVVSAGGAKGSMPDADVRRIAAQNAPVLLALDMDPPSVKATAALVRAHPTWRAVYVPWGKDVNEFFLANGKVRDWLNLELLRKAPEGLPRCSVPRCEASPLTGTIVEQPVCSTHYPVLVIIDLAGDDWTPSALTWASDKDREALERVQLQLLESEDAESAARQLLRPAPAPWLPAERPSA